MDAAYLFQHSRGATQQPRQAFLLGNATKLVLSLFTVTGSWSALGNSGHFAMLAVLRSQQHAIYKRGSNSSLQRV